MNLSKTIDFLLDNACVLAVNSFVPKGGADENLDLKRQEVVHVFLR